MKRALASFFLLLSLFALNAFAQSKVELQPNDTIRTVLQAQVGQVVELRLKSGEKVGGKLEKVHESLAHMSQLTGAEYYDAVVSIDHIAAVVVRARTK